MSGLVANPKDRFSCVTAHIILAILFNNYKCLDHSFEYFTILLLLGAILMKNTVNVI